ncbi:MAG: hypothetical protein EB084_11020 [Proteobacteria bacterium]|nr:hypothetical protein [Pseudomonadota bacterium]
MGINHSTSDETSRSGEAAGEPRAWTHDEVVAILEHSAAFLQVAVSGLKNDRLDGQAVADEATVRDIVAHLAVWEAEFLREARLASRRDAADLGERFDPASPVGGCLLSGFGCGDLEWERRHAEQLEKGETGTVFLALEKSQRVLLAFAKDLSPRALTHHADWPWGGSSTLAALLVTAAAHKRGHAEEIRSWRTRGCF